MANLPGLWVTRKKATVEGKHIRPRQDCLCILATYLAARHDEVFLLTVGNVHQHEPMTRKAQKFERLVQRYLPGLHDTGPPAAPPTLREWRAHGRHLRRSRCDHRHR